MIIGLLKGHPWLLIFPFIFTFSLGFLLKWLDSDWYFSQFAHHCLHSSKSYSSWVYLKFSISKFQTIGHGFYEEITWISVFSQLFLEFLAFPSLFKVWFFLDLTSTLFGKGSPTCSKALSSKQVYWNFLFLRSYIYVQRCLFY